MTKITKRGGQIWDLLKRSAGEMAEMVEPGSTTRETPSLREVAEGMLPRDPYEIVGEAQKKFKEGDKLGAAEEMLGGIPETGALRFKGPVRPLDTPRSVEEAIAYLRELPDVPEDMKWFQSGSFGPEVSMRELGFTNAPVLAGTKKFKPDAYVNVPLEQLRVVQPSATKELVGRYIQDLPEEMPAFSYFEEGPWKGFSQMSGTHRLAAAKALGLEKIPVGVFAKAMKPSGSPFSQTKDMPVGVSREMLQDIFGKDYLGYAKGGHVLEDDYPTHYLPNVGRQVMADGGVPSIDQIRQMLVGTAPAPSGPAPRAYTDPYGLKVAAPFVESMRGGYPTPPSMATTAPAEHSSSSLADLIGSIFGRRRSGYDQGGPVVEGDVSFLEDEPSLLPTFAQPQAQEVTQALDAAREVNQPKKEYEPFGVLPLKETEQGIEFDPYAGIMGSVTRPAKYFYETMTGQKEMEPTSEEAIRAATDIAGTLTMGSGAFERPAGALAAGASRPGMGHNMPPESIVPERVTNPLGMHSEAAEVARNLPQQRGTIEQMLAMMKQKVNPEELHWSGVAEAFQPGQKVTAEELASHFESKLPKVQETIYNAPENADLDEAFKQYWNDNGDIHLEENAHMEPHEVHDMYREQFYNDAIAGDDYTLDYVQGSELGNVPRYPTYVTPGGSNYREIVLHHPPSWKPEIVEKYGRFGFTGPDGRYRDYYTRADAEQSARSMARHDVDGFTESHYDEPNVLGHLRMSDMEGPGGEKILNVHEFQSDWGQQARKKGVVTPDLESKLDSVKLRLEKAGNEYYKMQNDLNELINSGQITYKDSFEHPMFQEVENARQNYVKLEEQRKALAQQSRGVPHSPYVTSREGQHNTPGWTDLLIKRVLQEAERGGYDKVVWDTPAEQAQRYMNQPQIVKGMQGYYGDLLPRRHKKVAPEIKIGEHEVGKPGSPTVKRPGFEMTPELKERIRRGLSAYRYGGEVEDALDVARSLK